MVKEGQNEKIKEESIRIERRTKENESSITKTRHIISQHKQYTYSDL